MEEGMELDYEELCRQAALIVEESKYTQLEIGKELGVSSGAMSRALSETGPKFSSLQRRIIERLTSYRIEQRVVFRAIAKE